jgi:O-antigen/teichoic acid export membrane protein
LNPFRKLASQTAIYGLPSIIGRLLNYFLVPLYTYQFSTAEFGIVTEMYAYVSFLIILLTYGMETTLFRFSHNEIEKDKVYSTSLISLIATSSLFIVLATIFSQPIADLLEYGDHKEYIVWFTLIIGLDALSAIPFAKLREQNKATKFAIIKSINILINIGLNLFFIGFCKQAYDSKQPELLGLIERVYDPEIGIGYIFISNLVASIFTIILLLPEIVKVNFRFDAALWKKMMIYALPLLIGGFAGMINETLDRVLLKYLLPDESTAVEQLGIYGACYKISIIMTLFIQTFRFAAEPFFFSNAKEKDSKQVYADVMKYFIIICSFIFLATMLNISWIQLFIGPDFRSGLGVVPILLLANLCLGIFFNLSMWYKLENKTRFGAYFSIVGAVITLVLNFLLIPKIGYMGSAWATLACYSSMMVISYFIGQKNYPIPYNLKRVLAYIGLSLILYWFSLCLNIDSQSIQLIVNNFLLLLFMAVIYFNEMRKIPKQTNGI